MATNKYLNFCGLLCLQKVCFDAGELSTNAQHAFPPVLFATEGGLLAQASASATTEGSFLGGSGAWPSAQHQQGLDVSATLLPRGGPAVNSFDVEAAGPANSRDIVCVTDSQELVYIRRAPLA